MRLAVSIAALALAAPGMAQAEPAADAALLAAAVRAQPPANASLVPLAFRPDAPDRPEGTARTSVERKFDGGRLSGAMGFLCGRPDNLSDTGGARVFGTDPHGRFVGARLSLALR